MSPPDTDSPLLSPRTWTFILLGCIAMAAVLLVFRFDKPREFPLPLWFFAAGVLSFLGNIIVDNIRRVQIRLAELMLNVILVAASTSIFSSILKSSFSVDPLPSVLFPLVLSVVFFGTGSFWGWKSAAQLEENRTWQRIDLMAYGWMLMIGIVSAPPFFLTLFATVLSFVIGGGVYLPNLLIAMLLSGLACILMLPAARVEREIRRRRSDAKNEIVGKL